ncbi:hypothetical protein CONLIGDRAFT_580307 [Coniochaeta ligniaria NRRL 30616]|uniref:Uncharacterized protein n=1 Tax=Coniochaeta ligniaria NRRL 30616 TaxID=1408157 RepID=A0A1J7IGU8_9PEZI|nr:hypothetical protein CONLIGDRAFT_580307 [Coniochaeta ligniaria NRRL 30616]
MTADTDLPIALRRTRRSLGTETPKSTQEHSHNPHSSLSKQPTPKPKKRVRFSDPFPLLPPSPATSTSTSGLTPLIRRTTLTPRRHSVPTHSSRSGISSSSYPQAEEEEIHITPLRQVLSGRVQRRIRRNGLSEEMNSIQAEKRREREEVARLKAEVAERDAEIARLRDETAAGLDAERVWELEREVEGLRAKLAGRDGGRVELASSPMNWTMAARDPFADEYTCMDFDAAEDDMDLGIDGFGEASMAELACSTPTRRSRGMLATPPTTSPAAAAARSSPPCAGTVITPRSHVWVQTDLADGERERIEEKMASLQLELAKLTTTLEGYAAFAERVASKLGNLSPSVASSTGSETNTPCPEVEAQITTLLQTLSDRTAALLELTSTISTLGFPGSDADEILRSIITAFRTARLELEYLTPGEISLPLTSSGAAVLDLLLDRLRDLARKAKEGDENIDEYHALELSLRQQLSARVDVTDALTKEITELKNKIRERDGRIEEQSVGLDRLKGAVASYARDVGELEQLVGRLEGEKSAAVEELEGRLNALEGQIAGLEEGHAEALRDMRKSHKEEVAGLNRTHGSALALRDARVAELRGEIERVNASLRAAHETVRKLRVEKDRAQSTNEKLVEENRGLAEGAEAERRKAKEVVDGMRSELERVVRMSEGLFLSGELAKRGGRKRRRYDSGLGFLDEEQVDV